MKTLSKLTIITTALTTCLIGAPTAFAGDVSDQVAFKYSKSAPIEQTYMTLKSQAVRQCGEELGVFKQYAGGKCINVYMEQILAKINSPQLSAFHHKSKDKADSIARFADASAMTKSAK